MATKVPKLRSAQDRTRIRGIRSSTIIKSFSDIARASSAPSTSETNSPIPPSVAHDLQQSITNNDSAMFMETIAKIVEALAPKHGNNRRNNTTPRNGVANDNEHADDTDGFDVSEQVHYPSLSFKVTSKILNHLIVDICGYHVLHKASAAGSVHIVMKALEAGADINYEDDLGRTPLHVAASCAHLSVCEALLLEGADTSVTDFKAWNVLHHAVEGSGLAVVKLFVASNLDVEYRCAQGMTALHWASYQGNSEIVEYLIDSSARIDALCKKDFTPLHYAVQANNLEVFDVLVNKGCRVSVSQPHQNIVELASIAFESVPHPKTFSANS
eukprot:m.30294 g.30294  ORF g.30294 m.30294 type:complete len:328 (-) comp16255_c0_seq1:34-1017(-)